MEIQQNIPLAGFTTLGVGGPARFFISARSEADIREALKWAADDQKKVFVLGGGSNILVSDAGFDGLVIKIDLEGVEFLDEEDGVLINAAAGEDWDKLVEATVTRGLAGFECMSGIPGTVGGTPVQNVGAYGQEAAETIVSVRCLDRNTREAVTLSNSACGFSYRKSIFNTSERDRYIVLSVIYRLKKDGKPTVSYKDLSEYFSGRDASIAEVREAVLSIRRAKSMVVDPADPNARSAGSFFKNPMVPKEMADSIGEMPGIGPVPRFEAGEGLVKIPAAWLIERAGLHKGYVLGNAGISQNHSLAIVNRGNASAEEIVALKNLVQRRVFDKFGIELQPEPILIGF